MKKLTYKELEEKELHWRALGIGLIVGFTLLVIFFVGIGFKLDKLEEENEMLKSGGILIPIEIICEDNIGEEHSFIFNEDLDWWNALENQISEMHRIWWDMNSSRKIEHCKVVR